MKSMIRAIIAGSCIITLGIIILLIALGLNGWTLKAHFSREEFNAEQENNKIIVDKSVGSMKINYYEGDKVQIFYPEAKNYKVSVSEKDGTVRVSNPGPKWYEFSIWWSDIPETVINLPMGTEFELDLTVNAGSLKLYEGQYSKVSLTVNAGTLNATGVKCETFSATVNAGSMQINSLECTSSFDGEVNAGSLNAKNVISPKITADVSAGSLNMSIIGKKEEYNIKVHVSAGSSNLQSQNVVSDKSLTAEVSAGSLNITFI